MEVCKPKRLHNGDLAPSNGPRRTKAEATGDNSTDASTEVPRAGEKPSRWWSWILNADGSPAVIDAPVKSETASDEYSLLPDSVSSSNPNSSINNHRLERSRWCWLLEEDGSYATVNTCATTVVASSSSSSVAAAVARSTRASNDSAPDEILSSSAAARPPKHKRGHRRPRKRPMPAGNETNAAPPSRRVRPKPDPAQAGAGEFPAWWWILDEDGSPATAFRTLGHRRTRRRTRSKYDSQQCNTGKSEDFGTDESEESEYNSDAKDDEEPRGGNAYSSSYHQYQIDMWENKFQQLVAYKEKHQTANVPYKAPLGNWVREQRKRYREGKVSKERIARLESIGFEWQLVVVGKRIGWMEAYHRLREYKSKHETTNVPQSVPILGNWVSRQRREYKKGKLSRERIARLESIGFEWRLLDRQSWNERYNLLVAYKKKHKTTNVPALTPEIGNWVNHQRTHYKKGKLSKEQIHRLESIGFEWCLVERCSWMEMYQRLVRYKRKHKTTRVSEKEDMKLAKWVVLQRHRCKEKHRIDLLNDIGFLWDASSFTGTHIK